MYMECNEEEATHVEILRDEHNHTDLAQVTVGKVYPFERDEDDEKTIQADNGDLLSDFPLYLSVKWMKEVKEGES